VLAEDTRGIVAFIASVLAHDECNIATMSVSRKGKNDIACHFYEMDSPLRPLTVEYLRSLKAVEEVIDVDLTSI
jgi:L-serine dehydratase